MNFILNLIYIDVYIVLLIFYLLEKDKSPFKMCVCVCERKKETSELQNTMEVKLWHSEMKGKCQFTSGPEKQSFKSSDMPILKSSDL